MIKFWITVVILVLSVPLVPFAIIGELPGISWIENPNRTYVFFVGALVLATDIALPIPSSVVAVFIGAQLGVFWGGLANFIGLSIGSMVGYVAGRNLGRPLVSRFFPKRSFDTAVIQQNITSYLVLVAFRPIPVLSEASVIVSGVAGMNARRVMLTLFISNMCLSLAYASIGSAGEKYSSSLLLIIGAISIPLVGTVVWQVVRRYVFVYPKTECY